jgi:hypothetical protein
MGCLLKAVALRWSHQMAGLLAVVGSFLPTGQVSIGVCNSLLLVYATWSDLLLFSSGSSWVAPQLQLWLVNFSPNKVQCFSFVYCPQTHEISSAIHHAPALGGCLVAPTLLSMFVSYPICTRRVWLLWEVGFSYHPHCQDLFLTLPCSQSLAPCPTPVLWGWFSVLSSPHCQW